MSATVVLTFRGRFSGDSFADFALHRAARLDLGIRFAERGAALVRVAVTGQADLVDAFEMACSLGPMDCLVDDVVRDSNTEDERWERKAGAR